MIRVSITDTGEVLGNFDNLKDAYDWHDEWSEQFGYGEDYSSNAPIVTFTFITVPKKE